MGLRIQAQLDARAILEDDSGFAWPVTLTSPSGVVTALRGFTTDVGQTIDPETGQAVAGRRASVALPLSSLPAMPEAVADRGRKPWLATFADGAGVVATWKVVEVLPDRAIGVVVLLLEVFKQSIVVLTGGLVLPRLQLAGSLSYFTLGGALVLPKLRLAGSVAPAVTLGGAITLPPLQVSGALTVGVNALSAMLRVANATLVSGDVSSLPDDLNANPAVQSVAGRRPTREFSANGLPCMRFGTNDVLVWPLIAATNNNNSTGWGFWFKPDSLVGDQELVNIWLQSSGPKLRILQSGSTIYTVAQKATGTTTPNGIQGISAPGTLVAGAWHFITFEYDSSGASNATKMVVSVAALPISLTFSNFGSGGAIGVLPSVTGNAYIGNLNDSASPLNPLSGVIGPRVYCWGAKMAGSTGLLTPAARAAYMALDAPT